MNAKIIQHRLKQLANKDQAIISQKFFKTGTGDYGEGDIFHGIRVPELRKLAKEYRDLPVNEVKTLLQSHIHEERLLALLILIGSFSNGDATGRKDIYDLYLENIRYINNWDLVDASAEQIIGAYLMDKGKQPLYRLAESKNMWERRIAIMSTFRFIKQNEFSETLKIAAMLLGDREDLIHKAVGWMLREIGKRNLSAEESFLKAHYKQMPRTMLRYAIEKFPETTRQLYLKGKR
jgi:3-methyladenine DNA glycosylase AlkD